MRHMREASSRQVTSVASLRRSLNVVSGVVSCLTASLASAQTVEPEDAALAQPTPSQKVRLAHDSAGPSPLVISTVTRLAAELRVAGFSVLLRGAVSEPDPAESDDTEVYADISVGMLADQVRLDISSRSLGTSGHVVLLGREREIGLLALQATEFLRAGLVPRASVERARLPRVVAPPTAAAAATRPAEQQGRWLLDVGPALLTNWGAGDRLPLLALGAGYASPRGVSLFATLDVPLHDARFETERGIADYRSWLAGARADYRLVSWSSGSVSLGLCAGAAKTTSEGSPLPPLEPLRASAWVLYLGASAGVEYRLTRSFAATAQARLVSFSPNPLVSIVGEARRLGSPAVLFGVGARLGTR